MKTVELKIAGEGAVLERQNSAALIERMPVPMAPQEREALVRMVRAEMPVVADAFLSYLLRGLERSRRMSQGLEERARQKAEELKMAKQRFTDLRRPCLLHAILFAACAAAAIAGELLFNAITLCYMLAIDPFSASGVAVAAAPATAIAVLKLVFARLLEEPWQGDRGAARSQWAAVGMRIALLLLGGLNLATLALLGLAREDAMNLIATLAGEQMLSLGVDFTRLNQAMVAVTVSIGVSGSLFLMLAFRDFRSLAEWRRARLTMDTAERELQEMETSHLESAAELAVWLDRWERRMERAQGEGDLYFAERMVSIKVVESRIPEAPISNAPAAARAARA